MTIITKPLDQKGEKDEKVIENYMLCNLNSNLMHFDRPF